jgi:zona occludens toxin (predicted ATPase)
MIKCYFGVPGCGKTTMLARAYKKQHKKYDKVYTINCDIKGAKRIDKLVIEKYKMYKVLILWDEITLDYDNRNFKEFSAAAKEFWLLHRHFNIDIIYATQNYENVDKKIRDITDELWYMKKPVMLGLRNLTIAKRIYRKININEMTSDLTLGYRFSEGLEKILVKNNEICIRRFFYKYFNTKEELNMEGREIYNE